MAVALAIDASSPAVANNTSASTSTVTTASFTPPAGSILLIAWSGNSHPATDPTAPSITDNLGVHLTYTLQDWSHRGDSPAADGQAAFWTAKIATSAAMTVTITNNTTGSATTDQQSHVKIWVFTGADVDSPIGAHGKSGSTNASTISQSYTAQRTAGWGFLCVCDWDDNGAFTIGSGCTSDGSAPSGNIAYEFARRTTADDIAGSSNSLNTSPAATSTNIRWAWAEVLPPAGGDNPRPVMAPPVIRRPWMRAAWLPWVASNGYDAVSTGQTFTADLAGSVTPTGNLTLLTSKALAGSVTPTGALAKAVDKPGLAGTSTPTGALAKQANKALSGSVTPTGVLTTVKVVLMSFAGAVTPTGALAKLVAKPLAGQATPTGVLAKQAAKALAGSVTATGSLTKAVSKALAGSVTPTGALANTRVILRSFAGSVTPTGVLNRQANKELAGSSTPTGTLSRAIAKTVSGSAAAVGALAKLVAKPFAGSSTPTGGVETTTTVPPRPPDNPDGPRVPGVRPLDTYRRTPGLRNFHRRR